MPSVVTVSAVDQKNFGVLSLFLHREFGVVGYNARCQSRCQQQVAKLIGKLASSAVALAKCPHAHVDFLVNPQLSLPLNRPYLLSEQPIELSLVKIELLMKTLLHSVNSNRYMH